MTMTIKEYFTVNAPASAELVQKKSKFIARVYPALDVESAVRFLNSVRENCHEARRHCYAYVVLDKDAEVARFSDDGEPFGTAGLPLLSVIRNANLVNVVVVVTRHFGGVLLGAGGLVRAYSAVGAKAVSNAVKVKMTLCVKMEIEASYVWISKIKSEITRCKAIIVDENYSENVKLLVFAELSDAKNLKKFINELTAGTVVVDVDEKTSTFFNLSTKNQ